MNGENGKNKDESSLGKEDKSSVERKSFELPEDEETVGNDATSNAGDNAENEESPDKQDRVIIDDKSYPWDRDSIGVNEIFDKISDDRVFKMVAIYDDREEPFEKGEDKSFIIEECNRFEVDLSTDGGFCQVLTSAVFCCLHYRSNRELSRHQFGRIKNVINRVSNQCVLFFPLIINKDHEIKDNLIFFGINGDMVDVASMKTEICKSLRISPATRELQIYDVETAGKLLEDFRKLESE